MSIAGTLAMTPEEFLRVRPLPSGAGWMSCRFSPQGLRDLPRRMPPGCLLILEDSIPPENTDPERIADQLRQVLTSFRCCGLLLDFQQENNPDCRMLSQYLPGVLPCSVGVSQLYAGEGDCPVFLSLLPPHQSLEAAVAPWKGRELWLEIGPAPEKILLTAEGSVYLPVPSPLPPCPREDSRLCCHYGIRVREDRAEFFLRRDPNDLRRLLRQGEALGVTRYAGLYRELGQLLF